MESKLRCQKWGSNWTKEEDKNGFIMWFFLYYFLFFGGGGDFQII